MNTQHGDGDGDGDAADDRDDGGEVGGAEGAGARFVEGFLSPAGIGLEARRRRLLALLEQDPASRSLTGDSPRRGSGRNGIGRGQRGAAEVSGSMNGPGESADDDPDGIGNGVDTSGVDIDAVGTQSWLSPGGRWRLQRVCVVAVGVVGVDGAGVTVMGSLEAGHAGARDQLAATDGLTRRLEDLQLTTAEGPCLDAYVTGLPVLVADLAAETTRWLGFGPEALAAGAAAVFSLPLQVGAVRLGTLDLYRARRGSLSTEQYADALTLATLATETLLDLASAGTVAGDVAAARGDTDPVVETAAGWLPDVHADVHVASGMVSVQAGIDIATALVRIRAHAFASSEPISDVAGRIIARDLVLDGPVLDPPGTEPTDPVDLPPDPENDP